jgi:hypothetical protein
VLHKAFLNLDFGFELFLAQEYWRKCAHKILVKLTPGEDFFRNSGLFDKLSAKIFSAPLTFLKKAKVR